VKIKLYNDIVFKWIFGRQEHTGPLLAFLNAMVGYDGHGHSSGPKFTNVLIMNPYDQSEPFTMEKQGILDLRLQEVDSKEWIDLEMQVLYSPDYTRRSKFYLAGMYRDQLKKSKDKNYDDLKPCYGVHLLLENFFRDKADRKQWFHHYTMLNTRTHQPLLNHWHLYYAELKKFIVCFESDNGQSQVTSGEKQNPQPNSCCSHQLEQWIYYLGNDQDLAAPLNSFVAANKGIKEVHDMLHTFTENDRLREKYRLHEEWLRVRRGEEAQRKKLEKALLQERLAKKQEQAAMEIAFKQERAAKEQERAAKEEERAAKEQERTAKEAALKKMDEMEKRSIILMRKTGHSDEEIATLLDIPLEKIKKHKFLAGNAE